MKKSSLAIFALCASLNANADTSINVPNSDEILKQISDLDTCIDQSTPYFTDKLLDFDVGTYAEMNTSFTTILNDWLGLLSHTTLTTAEKMRCIEQAVKRVRDSQ
ncbi:MULTISPECIES: hypothetical protein [Vibrio]|uniref:hypothetical protein n=1 Tax=Vibrio TaxID=662 RepID=UPI00078E3EE7|nr:MULTISPECIES: hypothetical protein [Vibrio]BAU70952.1 hypothetical protein [Vibrio sp. 04Ya108]BBM67790.1 hypothetical protein VA249_44360 [Vibrio alfacsensis]BCN26961.1 hypothetical protein VYA_41530 [Vibrio alfacsensis]